MKYKEPRKAVFPVAGFGTRFLPATKAMPKELLPVIDKPVIQYAAEEAVKAGFDTLVFVTGKNKRAIEDHFDRNLELETTLLSKGKYLEAEIVAEVVPSYVNCVFVRQSEQLGLGHAVACAENVIGNEPFAVILADDFLVSKKNYTEEMKKAFQKSGKCQLLSINVQKKDVSKYGIIKKGLHNSLVEALIEKPDISKAPSRLASIGRYILTPNIFELLKKIPMGFGGEIQLADAINSLASIGEVENFLFKGSRYDCGSVDGYTLAINNVAKIKTKIASPKKNLTCFKTYDVRGIIGSNVTESNFYRIARGFQEVLGAKKVILGRDNRRSSKSLSKAIAQGLMDAGCDVLDIGLCGTEEMYFATSYHKADGGLQVTASHNPIEYNGIKFVRKNSKPLDQLKHLKSIKEEAEKSNFPVVDKVGIRKDVSFLNKIKYSEKLISLLDTKSLKNLKIVLNCGNGAVGPALAQVKNLLERKNVTVELIEMNFEPDPDFKNGVPNPMLEENRKETQDRVVFEKADFGVAFDGDFDRCFFFDEKGSFISGEYIAGLLAEYFLTRNKKGPIVYDYRSVYNMRDIIQKFDGEGILSKSGHVFFKEKLRSRKAVYGGEISAHHYFKDFFYCDSGMIPWLLMCEIISEKQKTLSELICLQKDKFLSSGEINFTVNDKKSLLVKLKEHYVNKTIALDFKDGLSAEFKNWRFNVRSSNTENLIRLNIEVKNDKMLLEKKIKELSVFINNFSDKK